MSKAYDLGWAENVFMAFRAAYPRALQVITYLLKINRNTVIMWISSDQQRWEKFKKITKRTEQWLKMHHFQNITEFTAQDLSTLNWALGQEFAFYDASKLDIENFQAHN